MLVSAFIFDIYAPAHGRGVYEMYREHIMHLKPVFSTLETQGVRLAATGDARRCTHTALSPSAQPGPPTGWV